MMNDPIVRIPEPIYQSDAVLAKEVKEYIGYDHKMYGIADTEAKMLLGQGVSIGVIDSGGDRHPDIEAVKIMDMRSGFHPTENGGKYDYNGHGTHVASILFAQHNGFGVKGLVPRSKGYLYKALGDDGSGTQTDIIRAYLQAEKDGCDYAVLSLGSDEILEDLHDVMTIVYERSGMIAWCASGNDGNSTNRMDSPATHPLSISVGSHGPYWKESVFTSNRPEPDVYAPGERILGCAGTDSYQWMSGTSQAAPFACGLFAKYHVPIKQKYGKITPEIIRDFFVERNWNR